MMSSGRHISRCINSSRRRRAAGSSNRFTHSCGSSCRSYNSPAPDPNSSVSLASRVRTPRRFSATPQRDGPAGDAGVPTRGQHEHRRVEPALELTPVCAAECLASLQGGQALSGAILRLKHQNRTVTARKQRFLTAVHNMGLHIQPGRAARDQLGQYIQGRLVPALARRVERAGWHGRLAVTPGRVFGATDERVILSPNATAEHPFRQRDTLETWRGNVARVCAGNTRPTVAVSTAFAGPLLRLDGLQSGGFHAVGPSSRGKTSGL